MATLRRELEDLIDWAETEASLLRTIGNAELIYRGEARGLERAAAWARNRMAANGFVPNTPMSKTV